VAEVEADCDALAVEVEPRVAIVEFLFAVCIDGRQDSFPFGPGSALGPDGQ